MIGKRNKCVLLLLSQLNEEVPESGPTLSNLREGRALAHDADCVIFLFKPKKDANDSEQVDREEFHYKFIQAKRRRGKVSWLWTYFKPETTTFRCNPMAVKGASGQGRPKSGEDKKYGEDF